MTSHPHPSRAGPAAFTLTEVLAVVVVITLLLGIILATASFVQRKAGISVTRAELYAIEMALEAYKSDTGAYPLSFPARYGEDSSCEESNSWVLFRALIGGPKKYLKLDPKLLRSDPLLFAATDSYIVDSFGTPVNYYRTQPPITALTYTNWIGAPIAGSTAILTNFLAVGGQVNTLTFDLYSYGPDRQTYLPGSSGLSKTFVDPNVKADDIWCNRR